MNRDFIRNAPNACCILESSQKYVDSGIIANLVAQYLRDQGYPARAHIDGEYEVVCPLVARDANLGEIGRMGLLMTPKLGPMVRIAVVTTSAPLVEDRKNEDLSVVEFCRICKKCAEVCPSQAIAFTDRKEIKGVNRWQINQEACFTYWCKAGTDCARCVSVCPFAHPDNFLHNVVRHGIRNSKLFQIFALKMDNLIYGRKPARLKLPEWNRNDREE
jgi:reductive dehalogenase